nr:hypothetical protein [Tanacetum cinerariifolium]
RVADLFAQRHRQGALGALHADLLNATWRRDDGDAEAVADAGKFLRTGIDAAARLRYAGDVLDRRLALKILQLDADAGGRAHLFVAVATDIAFALQNVEHADAQLRRRREDGVLLRALAVADAGEQITQGIGHCHDLILTSSTW